VSKQGKIIVSFAWKGVKLSGRGVQGIAIVAGRICFVLVPALVPAMGRFLLGGGYDVLQIRLAGYADPVVAPVSRRIEKAAAYERELRKQAREKVGAVARPAADGIAQAAIKIRKAAAWVRKERKLRRAYRDEFQAHFPNYRAFRAHYEAVGRKDKAAAAPSAEDAFMAACNLFGLPENGVFNEAELKARYRSLMKRIHPDIAGANDRAAAANAARKLIKERKGWS
jgi:hypothetical protein